MCGLTLGLLLPSNYTTLISEKGVRRHQLHRAGEITCHSTVQVCSSQRTLSRKDDTLSIERTQIGCIVPMHLDANDTSVRYLASSC